MRTWKKRTRSGEALLSRYKAADGSLPIDGIFCPNESSTFAMLRVLQDNGWAGKVRFIGFDASENLVKGLADGHIEALVVQDPVNMGYLAVKTMVGASSRPGGREAHRHRRASRHARSDGRVHRSTNCCSRTSPDG